MEEILQIGCLIVFIYGLWQLWKHKNKVAKAIYGTIALLLLFYFLGKMF